MRVRIKTVVEANKSQVISGFDEKLFVKLSPPFPKVKLLRFDGCGVGDKVEIQLNFILFQQIWKSEIIESEIDDEHFYFIDIGKELPFFLKSWRHKHIITAKGDGCLIEDDINFSTGLLLTDILFYPAMYLQFAYRIPVYRRYFRSPHQ